MISLGVKYQVCCHLELDLDPFKYDERVRRARPYWKKSCFLIRTYQVYIYTPECIRID